MVVVQINFSCLWGSTGKICDSVSKLLSEKNIENYLFYIFDNRKDKSQNYIKYGNFVYTKFQALKSKVLGNYGFNSSLATKRLIRRLKAIKPDIVHIHNIHGHDCHFEILFKYFRENNIKVFYTFHDCWAFTGYCPHFAMVKCNKWLDSCHSCILRKRYSWFFDRSDSNFIRKRKALEGLDLTIITPSEWLGSLVKKSFLKKYPVKVINNGIDLNVFKPTESQFRSKYGLENKKIVLGVSCVWDERKGFDVFIELAKSLPSDYAIVLVGTNSDNDKQLPDNVISIHHTQNQEELAMIYTAADVFVNPTREENYPTVNMESLACGSPVITFETGGSPEMLDESCGSVVAYDDIQSLKNEITRVCSEKPYSTEQCLNKAKGFDKNDRLKEYVDIYERAVFTRTQGN